MIHMKQFRNALIALLIPTAISWSQEAQTYQKPPAEILQLADAPMAPRVSMDDAQETMLLMYRDAYVSIGTLSEPEMRLGGLRINPVTNIGSRTYYYNNLKLQKTNSPEVMTIQGLPENGRFANITWSPDQKSIAFTHTTDTGVALWVIDVKAATAKKLTDPVINANMGDAINWFSDSGALLVKVLPKNRKPLIDTRESVPAGPTISENDGKKAQNRTYQDLLKNPNDEYNFEQLALSELIKVSLDGIISPWQTANMYTSISFSPDGQYVMAETLEKPFSYIVPYSRFPHVTHLLDAQGKALKVLHKTPLLEELPQGFMAVETGKRGLQWRADKPATLIYTVALDGGDPAVEAEFRDAVYQWEAPFEGSGKELFKTKNRFNDVMWGDGRFAVIFDYWWNNRNTKTYVLDLTQKDATPVLISDRNYQDVYSDPGSFVTRRNTFGRYELLLDKNDNAYLLGDGYSENGQFPFLDRMNLNSYDKLRLYQSKMEGKKENLMDYNPEKDRLLVSIESPSEYPNYYFRSVRKRMAPRAITQFENPFKSLDGVHKEVLTYTREDGLELSGTLYLPAGYDPSYGEKLPMILWAYPREYKDKSSASQNTQNPNEFNYPSWGSPLYWVTRGYAILDDAAFPIVGEGEAQPNDSFRKQLVANAKAAIDAVDALGYIDRNKVAVGGHSYGAFMVANLLSHSNLFAAGIARSGAYNRTLTPFGFQSEERNYWEAPEVYYDMSPFMHADKMKTPLLLVHGEADNNSGTYPMQSERYFNALKGLGATVRLVMLPKESHGYRAKESILHLLWEQDRWLETYVKNATASGGQGMEAETQE